MPFEQSLMPITFAQLERYETEVRERRESAVPLSRQACLDAHGDLPKGAHCLPIMQQKWKHLTADSPLIGRRAGPVTAQRAFDL